MLTPPILLSLYTYKLWFSNTSCSVSLVLCFHLGGAGVKSSLLDKSWSMITTGASLLPLNFLWGTLVEAAAYKLSLFCQDIRPKEDCHSKDDLDCPLTKRTQSSFGGRVRLGSQMPRSTLSVEPSDSTVKVSIGGTIDGHVHLEAVSATQRLSSHHVSAIRLCR